LVLFDVKISILNHLNVLITINVLIIIVKNSSDIVIIGHLTQEELDLEGNDNCHISGDRTRFTKTFDLFFDCTLLKHHSGEDTSTK